MVDDALMDILHEFRRMGVAGQRVLGVLSLRRVALLLLCRILVDEEVVKEVAVLRLKQR